MTEFGPVQTTACGLAVIGNSTKELVTRHFLLHFNYVDKIGIFAPKQFSHD